MKISNIFSSALLGGAMFCSSLAIGQHNYELNNQGALIRVQAGADIYVQGDVYMEGASALLNHDGFMEVQGNMFSDNLFQQRGTGTVRMENNDVNVNDRQFIEGSYAVRGGQSQTGVNDGSFYNLELANTQGVVHLVGTGNVADVRNTVNFAPAATGNPPTNRIVTHDTLSVPANGSSYNAVFGMMNPTPGIGTFLNNTASQNGNMSGVDEGYVQGNLRRAIAPGGGQYGFLEGLEPAGGAAARGFQYIRLNFASPNNYDVVYSYFEQGSPNVIGGSPVECSFQITYFAGTDHGEWMFDAENAAGTGAYEVVIWPQDGPWPVMSTWFITKDNAIQGTIGDCGPSTIGLDRTAFNGFLSPSEFDFAGGSIILEENDLALSAVPVNNRYINVRWQNQEEANISVYELERSTDNLDFETIEARQPEGNDHASWSYQHPDYAVIANVDYFYRVRYTDQNGMSRISNSVQARIGGEGLASEVNVYPIPVGSQGLNLQIAAPEDKLYTVEVYDGIGKLVWKEALQVPAGVSERQIDTGNWAEGAYFMRLHSQGESIVKEILRIER